MSHVKTSRSYSRAEYLSDAFVHVLGIGAALIAGPILITLTAMRGGDAALIVAVSVYVGTLLAMLSCSALYNMSLSPHLSEPFRRLDQSVIYFKIAGTYTPFVALASGSVGFLVAIWGVAVAGVSVILLSNKRPTLIAILLYLGLGWAGAVAGGPLVSTLGATSLVLLVIGGLTYSAGVIFNLWYRLPFHNTIWHVFVLVGTVACYGAILNELLLSA